MHNEYEIKLERIVSLKIWDYLLDGVDIDRKFDKSVNIAGNLNKNKVKYLSFLPENVKFELFGQGYDGNYDNINYHGSFDPDELPFKLKDGFGLVWDGDSSETCSGNYGEYLRINCPHKTSLYLASGLPVIVWEEAAISKFVLENNCGITISSLSEIKVKLDNIDEAQYMELQRNANIVGERIRKGYYMTSAINALI